MSDDYQLPILTHAEIEAWRSELAALQEQQIVNVERQRWLLRKVDAATMLMAAKAVPRPTMDATVDGVGVVAGAGAPESEANDGVR